MQLFYLEDLIYNVEICTKVDWYGSIPMQSILHCFDFMENAVCDEVYDYYGHL